METKICCHCKGDPQPIKNFYKRTNSPDGLAYLCKKCAIGYVNGLSKFIPKRLCALPNCDVIFQPGHNATIFHSPSHTTNGKRLGITKGIDLKDDPRKEHLKVFDEQVSEYI